MADSKGRTNGTVPTLAVSRAMLATAGGKKKLDLIFDAPDPKAFVRALPAEDLYFAIREIGLADASDVVGLASPGQFRAFVDLDAWERDQIDPTRALLWMRLAMEGAKSSGEFRAKRKGLDPELIVLVLKTQTVVHPLEEGEDPVLSSDNWLKTAEGKYIVEITAEGDDGVTARKLLEDFIEENPFEATRLFEAVRWEMQSELEENCARWRKGRVRDMGFPDFEEAMRIWTALPAGWKPREEAPGAGHVAGVPALLLTTRRETLFLDRVVEQLPDEDRGPFNEGLVYLLNCAIVADGVDPKDLDLARGSLAGARDQLSLGLELASDGDETRALAILSATPPVEIFRFAVTELYALAREATQAARPLTFGEGQTVALDSPDAEIVAGLKRKRPKLYDPPVGNAPKHPGGDFRTLRDRADLKRSRDVLANAKAAGTVLESLAIDQAKARVIAEKAGRAPTAVTVTQLALTSLAAQILGKNREEPLAAEDVASLGNWFADGKLKADVRARLADETAKLTTSEPARALVAGWISQLENELGPASHAGPLDPRFVEAVLVRA